MADENSKVIAGDDPVGNGVFRGIEMHTDITIDVARRRQNGEAKVLERIFLPKWREGGVKAAFVTVGGDSPPQCPLGDPFPLESAIFLTEALLADIAESSDLIAVAKEPGDLSSMSARGLFPIVLHVEGSRPFEFDPSILRLWHLMGLRSVALTWNFRNAFADGAAETRTGGGLSNAGLRLLKEIEDLGMVLDLAHLSEAGFWQVAENFDKMIVVSHAACRGVYDHDRNVSDDQIKALAARGGVLGIAFYPTMLGEGPATMDKIMRHYAHAAELVGAEHLAIGPDFIDYAPDLIVPKLMKSGFSKNFDFAPELGSITQLQNLATHLKQYGFSDDDVRGIFWDNAERVYDASV